MARFREKTEDELVWNQIRRQITRDIDTQIQNRREVALNTVLPAAFKKFRAAVARGELREIEARYDAFAAEVVKDLVPDNLIVDEDVDLEDS